MGLVRGVSDYFFGTDVLEHYRQRWVFEKEFASFYGLIPPDWEDSFRNQRILDYGFSVVFPNLFSAAGVCLSLANEDPAWMWMVSAGEGLRLYGKSQFNSGVKDFEARRGRAIREARILEENPALENHLRDNGTLEPD